MIQERDAELAQKFREIEIDIISVAAMADIVARLMDEYETERIAATDLPAVSGAQLVQHLRGATRCRSASTT